MTYLSAGLITTMPPATPARRSGARAPASSAAQLKVPLLQWARSAPQGDSALAPRWRRTYNAAEGSRFLRGILQTDELNW